MFGHLRFNRWFFTIICNRGCWYEKTFLVIHELLLGGHMTDQPALVAQLEYG